MPKFFDDQTIRLPRINEDVWFEMHQEMLLKIVNTLFGRTLMHIPKDFPTITRMHKNMIECINPDGSRTARFHIGAKWANVIRFKWEVFNSYARYFSPAHSVASVTELNVPMSSLTRAARAVMASATLTVYPDPNVETTTVDGWAGDQNNTSNGITWANIRNEPGESNGDSETTLPLQVGGGTIDADHYEALTRCFALFNTASLTSGAVISAASLVLNAESKNIAVGASSAWTTNICGSNPASNTAIAASDYATSHFTLTKYSTGIAFSSQSGGNPYTFALNASGLAVISKTGVTKFGILMEEDIDNTNEHNQGGRNQSRVSYYSADQTGTTSDPALTVTYTVPPAAPSGLAAASVDASQNIVLTWTDNSSDETGFSIERSNDGATGWTEITVTAANAVTYTDSTVGANSTTRYYRMRAYKSSDGSYSAYTSNASATTAPAAPSALAVAAVSASNNLVLTWTDNSSDESTFRIERSNNGSTGWSEIGSVSAGVVTYTDTTVGARDTQRYYRVRALRAGDTRYSSYSSNGNATTAPADPTTLAAAVNGLVVTLTWADISTSNTGYDLERKYGATPYATLTSPAANAVTYVDTVATLNQTYTYKLRAYRSSDGVYSGFTAEVTASIPVEAPTNVEAACSISAASNASKVRLAWEINSTEETGFLIERSTDNLAWSTVTTTSAGVRTYEDSGLAQDTTYYYRVSAVGAVATSSSSASGAVKTSVGKVADLLMAFDKKTGNFPLS